MTVYLTILATSILVGIAVLILIETPPRARKAFLAAAITNAATLLLIWHSRNRRK